MFGDFCYEKRRVDNKMLIFLCKLSKIRGFSSLFIERYLRTAIQKIAQTCGNTIDAISSWKCISSNIVKY